MRLAALAVAATLIAQAVIGQASPTAASDPDSDSDAVQVTVVIAPLPDPPDCGNEPWPPGWPRRGDGPKADRPGNGHGPKHDCPGDGNGNGPKPEHPGNGHGPKPEHPGNGNGPKSVASARSEAGAPYDVVSKRAR